MNSGRRMYRYLLKMLLGIICVTNAGEVCSQCTSVSDGDWDIAENWSNCGGTFPLNSSAIVAHTLEVENNAEIDLTGDITIQNNGVINWDDGKSNWTGDILIEAGGVFNANRVNNQGFALTGGVSVLIS